MHWIMNSGQAHSYQWIWQTDSYMLLSSYNSLLHTPPPNFPPNWVSGGTFIPSSRDSCLSFPLFQDLLSYKRIRLGTWVPESARQGLKSCIQTIYLLCGLEHKPLWASKRNWLLTITSLWCSENLINNESVARAQSSANNFYFFLNFH